MREVRREADEEKKSKGETNAKIGRPSLQKRHRKLAIFLRYVVVQVLKKKIILSDMLLALMPLQVSL